MELFTVLYGTICFTVDSDNVKSMLCKASIRWKEEKKTQKFQFGFGTKPNDPPHKPKKHNTGYLGKVRVRVRKTTILYIFFKRCVVGGKVPYLPMFLL